MLTYLSNESRIIPLTMATRSSAKLLHSKSYAGGPRRHAEEKNDPLKGQHAIFITVTSTKLVCDAPVVLFLQKTSSPLRRTGHLCTLVHVNLCLLRPIGTAALPPFKTQRSIGFCCRQTRRSSFRKHMQTA